MSTSKVVFPNKNKVSKQKPEPDAFHQVKAIKEAVGNKNHDEAINDLFCLHDTKGKGGSFWTTLDLLCCSTFSQTLQGMDHETLHHFDIFYSAQINQ